MKKLFYYFIPLMFAIVACEPRNNNDTEQDTGFEPHDTSEIYYDPAPGLRDEVDDIDRDVTYSNERYRNVIINRLNQTGFRVSGLTKVEGGVIRYDIEDGHYVLSEGTVNVDYTSEEWSPFSFTVEAEKAEPHSTLHIILFEQVNGRRQYELPIPLY